MSESGSQLPGERGVFATTHWTVVLASRGTGPEARQALSDLCAAYYAPVVAVLRAEHRTDDQARELAHAFFERVLERHGVDGADPARGRFRSYLLGALKHFLANRRAWDQRQRRGGEVDHVPWDAESGGPESGGEGVEEEKGMTPNAAVFDRAWALQLLARALETLGREASENGTRREFEVLKPWLAGEPDDPGRGRSQAEAARAWGGSEGAFRTALHRLRGRFRALVKAEIGATVGSPGEIDEELRHLIEAVAAAPQS